MIFGISNGNSRIKGQPIMLNARVLLFLFVAQFFAACLSHIIYICSKYNLYWRFKKGWSSYMSVFHSERSYWKHNYNIDFENVNFFMFCLNSWFVCCRKRMTVHEALDHPWLNDIEYQSNVKLPVDRHVSLLERYREKYVCILIPYLGFFLSSKKIPRKLFFKIFIIWLSKYTLNFARIKKYTLIHRFLFLWQADWPKPMPAIGRLANCSSLQKNRPKEYGIYDSYFGPLQRLF